MRQASKAELLERIKMLDEMLENARAANSGVYYLHTDDCYYWTPEAYKQFRAYADALNQIAILGMGELAYTKDFTEKVNMIARSALK